MQAATYQEKNVIDFIYCGSLFLCQMKKAKLDNKLLYDGPFQPLFLHFCHFYCTISR